jgi:hypothetical protein
MTALPTTVYLNHAPSHLRGFGVAGPADLHAAASFTLELAGQPHREAITAALETVFEQLNIDEPTSTCGRGYRTTGLRSLSVGDVVVIGETAWACASSGWDLLTADQLHAAIYH